jgi:hypothetical protein
MILNPYNNFLNEEIINNTWKANINREEKYEILLSMGTTIQISLVVVKRVVEQDYEYKLLAARKLHNLLQNTQENMV